MNFIIILIYLKGMYSSISKPKIYIYNIKYNIIKKRHDCITYSGHTYNYYISICK